ncbi:MAG: hypothetical protein GY749_14790 [Desulfobacteraceae bacterium]|nr:hypothetical protein [Desulfobacteraceae bacterium]
MLKVQVGCSIRSLLCKQTGVASDYVDERISTVFLDGKPVDDVDSAIVKNGSVLALSAAMPGLVGTTLRKGGHLASLRSTITHRKEDEHIPNQEGFVVIKLFNLLIRELGPAFLEQGVMIKNSDFEGLLKSRFDEIHAGCRGVSLNGKEMHLDKLVGTDLFSRQDHILLRIIRNFT